MQSSRKEGGGALLIAEHFAPLVDPRVQGRTDHPLMTVIVMALAATIAGCEGWEDIEEFCHDRRAWFATFLEMPCGVPSDSTFFRVFASLRPAVFEACMRTWVRSLNTSLAGVVVAFDGKAMRGAMARAGAHSKLHMVHVWACAQRLLLGFKPVEGAPQEGEAVREMLKFIEVRGAILTGDAAHCNRPTAQSILDAEADYLLQLKANQKNTYAAAMDFFATESVKGFEGIKVEHRREGEIGHGRGEVREAWTVSASECPLPGAEWPELASVTLIERTRVVGFKISKESHVYLSSLPPDVLRIMTCAREHWDVENGLHWVLDVQMREDACAIHDEIAAPNVATLRRIALTLLRRDDTFRHGKRVKGVAAKQRKANRSTEYLEHIFSLGIP